MTVNIWECQKASSENRKYWKHTFYEQNRKIQCMKLPQRQILAVFVGSDKCCVFLFPLVYYTCYETPHTGLFGKLEQAVCGIMQFELISSEIFTLFPCWNFLSQLTRRTVILYIVTACGERFSALFWKRQKHCDKNMPDICPLFSTVTICSQCYMSDVVYVMLQNPGDTRLYE